MHLSAACKKTKWGRALLKCGESQTLFSFKKLRIYFVFLWSETLSGKVFSRKGYSPDYKIRALISN